jgi:hypothetical protein
MGFGSLIQRITYKVSGRSAASSGLYTPSTNQYDYAIGGIPFLSATSDNRPDIEKPVPQRKQQFDNYKDPGEYSLDQWWLRSQSSFQGGEGIIYQDPDTQGQAKNIRYHHSIGIDPFTNPAQISLIRETEQATAVSGSNFGSAWLAASFYGGLDRIYVGQGSNIETRSVTANDLTIVSTATIPTSGTTQGIDGGIVTFTDNTVPGARPNVYAFMVDRSTPANAGIWKAADGSAAVPTQIYNNPPSLNFITMGKGRGFMMVGIGNALYQLSPYTSVTNPWPVSPNAAVPVDQVIVAISDGPDAVYVAANSETEGYIYKTTFNSLGVVNGLSVAAILPQGELVGDAQVYLNSFIVISTNLGIRVGTFGFTGITYGPILSQISAEPINNVYKGFGRIAFYGTRAYVCTRGIGQHDGDKGVMVVDLGNVNQDQNTGASFNAWTTWSYFPGNQDPLIDITTTGQGRVVFSTGFRGASGPPAIVYVEHATTLIAQGYLDTGRCRFNTQEPKLFKYCSVRTPATLNGEITVTLLDDSGGITNYLTYGPNLSPGTDDIATPTPGGPRNYESLRFTLRRGVSDPSIGAVMNGWQIKALPGTLKQRIIMHNLLCFNQERDKGGQIISGDTLSLDRLTSVRQMCQRGDTVTFQDLANNLSVQVIIDDYQFVMMAPPGPNKENYGGYLSVTMRTVADAVPNTTPVMVEGD